MEFSSPLDRLFKDRRKTSTPSQATKTFVAHQPIVWEIEKDEKQRLETNVAKAAKLFSEFGKPFFLAGGTAMELHTGNIRRRHHDLDFEMMAEDLPAFDQFMEQKGYKRILNQEHDATAVEQMNRSARYYKGNVTIDGPDSTLEVFFMRRDGVDPTIVHSAFHDIPLPASFYSQDITKVSVQNQEVPLSPKVALMLYKMYLSNRATDIHDLKQLGSSFSHADREAVLQLWDSTHINVPGNMLERFEINKQYLTAKTPNAPVAMHA